MSDATIDAKASAAETENARLTEAAAAGPDVAGLRAAALEEAAHVCDVRSLRSCMSSDYGAETEAIECAAEIRALANLSTPPLAPSVAVVAETWCWPDGVMHDPHPKPHGLPGRWCARCGISETTATLEGMKCQPIYAGQKPYSTALASSSNASDATGREDGL